MEAHFTLDHVHRLHFVRGVFSSGESTLGGLLAPTEQGAARILVFVDQGVVDAWPGLIAEIERWASRNANDAGRVVLAGPVRVVPGGESVKNDRSHLDDACQAIHDAGLCRRSYVLVVGGGAVLDMVGFAAAICHRGVRLVRVPTTTLSQGDSGIGVKNGINAFGKKNYLGVFAVPWAVVNDEALLKTLSDRDWRSGFVEAVKVALIKDRPYFEQIARDAVRIGARDEDAAIPVLRKSAAMHVDHIAAGGDPFELLEARPLDFGHWAGHKLEQMTDFELRHGEAVAIGIAIDVVYSAQVGLLSWDDAQRALRCLTDLGFTLRHPAMADAAQLLQGLEEFREHLGGELTITLLRGLGEGVEVHEIDADAMTFAINKLVAADDPTTESLCAAKHRA